MREYDYDYDSYPSNVTVREEQQVGVTIVKLWMCETGTFNKQFFRPYEASMDHHTARCVIDKLNDHYERNPEPGALTGRHLAGLSSALLHPTATPQGEIVIPNGWNERRIQFIMETHEVNAQGTLRVYYFQGYTDRPGVSYSGAIDPEMVFYINSYTMVGRTSIKTPYGLDYRDRLLETGHVLNGQLLTQQHDRVHMMAPTHMFSEIHSNYIKQSPSENVKVINTRSTLFPRTSIRSKRAYNIPSSYLTSVVEAHRSTNDLLDFGGGREGLLGRCSDITASESLNTIKFIRTLSDVTGMNEASRFTYQDLRAIQPDIELRTNFHVFGNAERVRMRHEENTEYWNNSNRETVFASALVNGVSALMMELLITRLSFTATNDDITGQIRVTVFGTKSFTEADYAPNVESLIRRLETELLYDITFGNSYLFRISMNIDLIGETTLTVSLEGGPEVQYAAPSFCDSLTSSILSTDQNHCYTLAENFETLLNQVGEVENYSPGINYNV